MSEADMQTCGVKLYVCAPYTPDELRVYLNPRCSGKVAQSLARASTSDLLRPAYAVSRIAMTLTMAMMVIIKLGMMQFCQQYG